MKKILLINFPLFCLLKVQAQSVIATVNANFESPTTLVQVDPTPGNIWQIGTPQKTFFGTAHSGTHSIMTDSVSPYPINNLSTFQVPYVSVYPGNMLGGVEVSFWHKYQTELNMDGGFIEISVDSGTTWQNVATQTYGDPMYNNIYSSSTTITGGIPAYTGTQSSWLYSACHIQFLMAVFKPEEPRTSYPMTGKAIFRFNYSSDNTMTGDAGWIIDDITINEYDIGGGMREQDLAPFEVQVFPNPSAGEGIIQVVPKSNDNNFLIALSDVSGKKIIELPADVNNQLIITPGNLNAGLYLYTVRSEQGNVHSGKLIIK